MPQLIHEYLAPGHGSGAASPFSPAPLTSASDWPLGAIVKRTAADRIERLLQWCVPIGFALVFTAQYFSNIPYSIYPHSNFWTDSPALILIRAGICLLMLAGAYLWTEFGAGAAWSWMQALGKTSLMAYWVHVMLVYGGLAKPFRRALNIPESAAATVTVTAAMVGLPPPSCGGWRAARKSGRSPHASRREFAITDKLESATAPAGRMIISMGWRRPPAPWARGATAAPTRQPWRS